MIRAAKISLEFITPKKRNIINSLLDSYRAAVNFYINIIWNSKDCKIYDNTYKQLSNTRLSARYKVAAYRQAFGIIKSTKESAKKIGKEPSCPVFNGSATLDSRFIVIEEGNKSFDLIIKLSILGKSGKRIVLPCKKTKLFNKWNKFPNSRLIQGCHLSENQIILWFDITESQPKNKGKIIGIDFGLNKFIVDSNGKFYGEDFKTKIRDKIKRKKPGSKSFKRAQDERTNYINRVVKELPWHDIKIIGTEDLTNIKKGKKRGRGKTFRKALAPWTVRQGITRVKELAHENRVLHVAIDPRNTSRTCPSCGTVDKLNRKGEKFCCISCDYKNDADIVGATNVLGKTLLTIRSLKSRIAN